MWVRECLRVCVIMWHLSTCLKFCSVLYFLSWGIYSLSFVVSLHSYTLALALCLSIFIAISSCVCICHVCHLKDYFPFLFFSSFTHSSVSLSFFAVVACVYMCVTFQWSKSNYIRYTRLWFWMHFYLRSLQFLLLLLQLLFSFGNSDALNTDRIYWLTSVWSCVRVSVSMAIIYYRVESDASNGRIWRRTFDILNTHTHAARRKLIPRQKSV